MSTNPSLNAALNQIHNWSQPEQPPMMRMFLTRLAEIATVIIEAATLAFTAIEFTYACCKQLALSSSQIALEYFPNVELFKEGASTPSAADEIINKVVSIASLIGGLASTCFFGVFISPEANFKIHLKLELVTDNLAKQTQNALTAKLEIEKQKTEIEKSRNERYAELEDTPDTTTTRISLELSNLLAN